jgi:hypothetical protein
MWTVREIGLAMASPVQEALAPAEAGSVIAMATTGILCMLLEAVGMAIAVTGAF